ncbi:heterokaryon incompatibility protein [Fusarium heterosporum]|uniref:Heterokaryon incompatibility protein n=1 Tax=Fusarium heterosporum TaxID=42747 RepID=A0A8H5X059_FUSHE|nr:heterokaryon incompatibility protein [Fusarium heterosporum]
MASTSQHVCVAIVAPLRSDYYTARVLLSDVSPEYHLASSGAACTVGKVGPHHTVLVGNAEDKIDIALFVSKAVTDLLAEYPAIRAGLIVGVDAAAPRDGIANIGDVVVGIPQGFQPGLIQFTLDETHTSLTATQHMMRTPSSVVSAIHSSKSRSGREKWAQYFKTQLSRALSTLGNATGQESKSTPSEARVLYGKIASTTCSPSNPDMFDKVAKENDILCFERAVANLTPQLPFLTVCGVTRHSDTLQAQPQVNDEASIIAVIYALFAINNINIPELAQQHTFTNLHVYEPFSLDRPGFRLIRLEKGSGTPLECHLFQAYLDDETTIIPYKALSYVWGSQDTPCEVKVNGKAMFITESLHDALKHIRQPDEDEVLWVDALCIDQGDIKERGHQVGHMGEIYRKSDKVIIWLGFFNGDAARLKYSIDDFKRQTSSSPFPKWPRDDLRWKELWRQIPNVTEPLQHERLIRGFQSFMNSPWFTRVWILQEVANAKTAVIQCNLGSIPTKVFALLPYILDVTISQQCQAVLDIMPGPSKLTSWWNENRTLGMLLYKFRDCQATDPRDRAFALLGMASDIKNNAIQADYSRGEDAIVENISRFIFGEEHRRIITPEIRTIQELQSALPRISSELLVERLKTPITTDELLCFLDQQCVIGKVGGELEFSILLHGNTAMRRLLEKSASRFSVPFGHSLGLSRNEPLTFEAVLRNHLVSRGMKAVIDEVINHCSSYLDHVLGILQHPFELEDDLVLSKAKRGEFIAIRDSDIVEALLKYCNHPINPTRNMVHHATVGGIEYLKLIIPNWRSEMLISEFVTWQAISAYDGSLEDLLDDSSSKIQLTEVVLRLAKDRVKSVSKSVKDIINKMQKEEIDVHEDEAIETIMRGPGALLALLNRPGTNFKITDRIRKFALKKTYACDILSNRRYSEMWPDVDLEYRYYDEEYPNWPLESRGQIIIESRHENQYNLEHRHERRGE